MSEVGGENRSGADDHNRESKPSAHPPAPHARHDRSMARSSLVARPIFREKSIVLARRVQRPLASSLVYVLFCYLKLSSKWDEGDDKACCLHEMLVITMLSARWRKDEGIQRCDPRYKNKGSVNLCFDEVRRVASEKEPNQHPVFRDPKVLPGVRNRSLFSKGISQLFELGNSSLS